MANHPYNNHREQQVAHRRVGTILSGSPSGATKHASGHAFSKLTSKSAAVRDDDIAGRKTVSRFARGGRVKKGSGNTNIAIVLPKGGGPDPAGPAAGPLPPPMAGPGGPPPPMGGPPGMPPGMPPPPPGMPMRARGGRINKAGGGPTHIPGDTMSTKNARAMNKFGERGDAPIRPSVPMSPTTSGFVAGERKSGGRITKADGGAIAGEDTDANNKKWANRAKENSYFTGGAITGVGREEKAAHAKRR